MCETSKTCYASNVVATTGMLIDHTPKNIKLKTFRGVPEHFLPRFLTFEVVLLGNWPCLSR